MCSRRQSPTFLVKKKKKIDRKKKRAVLSYEVFLSLILFFYSEKDGGSFLKKYGEKKIFAENK